MLWCDILPQLKNLTCNESYPYAMYYFAYDIARRFLSSFCDNTKTQGIFVGSHNSRKRTVFYIRSITCVISREKPVGFVARVMNLCFSDVGGKKVCSKHFILLIAVTIFICVAYLYFCLVLVEKLLPVRRWRNNDEWVSVSRGKIVSWTHEYTMFICATSLNQVPLLKIIIEKKCARFSVRVCVCL